MRYYILPPDVPVRNGNDYQIIKVNEVDEAGFLKDYGDKIIASGSNLVELIQNF